MTQPPSNPAGATWHGDPMRDFVTYLLLRLARRCLGAHFDDLDAEENYATRQKREGSRGRTGKPRELAKWDDDAGCAVTLKALPEKGRFSLAIRHASFSAEISATFDPMIEEMDAASVISFSGDIKDAVKAINSRLDSFDEDDIDLDLEDLEFFSGDDDDESEDDADPSDDPPYPSDAEIDEVERMAQRLARRFSDDKAPDLTNRDRDWLESTPQSLWAILEGALEAAGTEPSDVSLVAAWRFLLSNQLELIRYRSERGYAWADTMLDEYQQRIVDLAGKEEANSETLFMLLAALNHAKVPIKPEVGEAVVTAEHSPDVSLPPSEMLNTMLRPMIDQLAEQLDTPFEAVEALEEVTGIAPLDVRIFLAHELALSPHPVLRDTVPLMLLDAQSEVRRAAAAALEQIAAPDTLSPVSLRRIIALRNWIPEVDRAALDQAIRKARTKGVEIAQWDKPADLAMYASPIDGSGAQSLLVATRSGRTGMFCGVLVKHGFGVRDVWCNKDMPRREIASGLAEVQRTIASPEVERAYFDVAIQHHIAAGLANDHLAGPALLEIAEAAGGADWKDRRIDAAAEAQRLFQELPPPERSAEAIEASLRRSGNWALHDKIADSWFDDDAEIRDAVAGYKGRDVIAAARMLLNEVFEGRRGVWAERCLLMTLWATAVKAGHKAPPWRDFLVLAHELLSSRALTDIPAMMHIAGRTTEAARSGER